MSYRKINCPECGALLMTGDDRVPAHKLKGTIYDCDGGGDEVPSDEGAPEAQPAEVAASEPITNQDEQSSPTEETHMPEEITVDLAQLEEIAASGATKSAAAQRLGMMPTTFSAKLKKEDFREAWERGVKRYEASTPEQTQPATASKQPARRAQKKGAGQKRKTGSKSPATARSEPTPAAVAPAPPAASVGDEAKPHRRALEAAAVELNFMRFHGVPSNKHDEVVRELAEAIGG